MRWTSPLRKRAKPHDSCDPAQSPTYVHLLPDDMPEVDFLDALVVAKPVETVEVEPEAVAVAVVRRTAGRDGAATSSPSSTRPAGKARSSGSTGVMFQPRRLRTARPSSVAAMARNPFHLTLESRSSS